LAGLGGCGFSWTGVEGASEVGAEDDEVDDVVAAGVAGDSARV